MTHNTHHLLASSALFPLWTPPGLCMMAAEGEEGAAGGGGTATATDVGGVQRVVVGNDGVADAAATAGATSSGAQPDATTETAKEGTEEKPAPATEEKPAPVIPDDPRFEPFTKEFTDTGSLKPESVAEAAKAFLGEDNPANRLVVETYLKGLQGTQAEATVAAAPFHEAAGGTAQWGEFQQWSAQEGNLSPALESAYSTLLEAGKTEEALAVLQPALSAWKASGGGGAARDVTTSGGGAGGGNAADSYANWEQVQVDMNNPKYASDPAFRTEVEQKLGRSTFT